MPESKISRARIALAALSATLLLLLVAAPSRGAAAEATKKGKEKMPSYPELMEMKPGAVMDMMDKGNKGYVTKEEFMKFYEALFKRLDRDESGTLTAPEFNDRG